MGRCLATAAQMREMDRRAIEVRGIPSLTLMENAARAVAGAVIEHAAARFPAGPPDKGRAHRAVLFCGPGNNGGDGVAAARLLLAAGWQVRALLVGKREKMTRDCREMEARLLAVGERLIDFTPGSPEIIAWTMEANVIVDAVFGIGLNSPVRGDALAAIALMNQSPAPTLAVDLPSGVAADTGVVLGAAVNCVKTISFTLPKIGQFVGKGALHAGQVIVAPIGIPEDLVPGGSSGPVRTVEAEDARLPRRARDAHKGHFGRLYCLAGSVGYTGAPVLAARAAVRSGAGLVTLAVPEEVYPIVAVKCDEAMPRPLPADYPGILAQAADSQVALIGPGLGRAPRTARLVRALLKDLSCPVVLDADGINAVSGHINSLDGRAERGLLTVLTPHDGEFGRLGGDLSSGDRLGAARDFAAARGCILVLKGHRTITAFPDGTAYVNTTGNPGMAKGGSGDVLAGVIAALLGQGLVPRMAVPAAVWLHGRSGDLAARQKGEYSMTPSDMIEYLPQAMRLEE
ncbi:MAG: NAD(P)H-hydrate dehydratase [Clostridiales bacterium]|nr:NAD(P)H-hydrate dehydratase [Clostridiales bacterium]